MKRLSTLLLVSLGLAASTSLAQFTAGRVVVLQCNGTVTTTTMRSSAIRFWIMSTKVRNYPMATPP